MKRLMKLFRDEEGATAVEYGIMVACIAAIIIASVITVGDEVLEAFDYVGAQLATVPDPAAG